MMEVRPSLAPGALVFTHGGPCLPPGRMVHSGPHDQEVEYDQDTNGGAVESSGDVRVRRGHDRCIAVGSDAVGGADRRRRR